MIFLVNYSYSNFNVISFTTPNFRYLLIFNEKKLIFKVVIPVFYSLTFFYYLKNFFFLNSKNKFFTGLKSFFSFFKTLELAFFFFFKCRLRFSGLSYFAELIDQKYLKINAGFTKAPIIKLPFFLIYYFLNKKNKKFLACSFDFIKLSGFCANIRLLKPIDVYKRKGIRFRFEKVKIKIVKKKKK